jgi:hypothetical protein
MKPQALTLESEVFIDFREKLDATLAMIINNMIDKDLRDGAISCNINIRMAEMANADGEMMTVVQVEPEINMRIGSKAKVKTTGSGVLIVKRDDDGIPYVGSSQISIDELLSEKEG